MLATGSNPDPAVTVTRDAQRFRESLTRCRHDVAEALDDRHVRNLIKRIEHDRAVPHEHIVTILFDAFRRGAPREAVIAPARTLEALVDSWYAALEANDSAELFDLARAEAIAEAEANIETVDLMDPTATPGPVSLARSAQFVDRHLDRLKRLSRALHHRLAQPH